MGILNFFKIKNQADEKSNEAGDLLLKALMSGEDIDRKKALSIPVVSGYVDLICNTFAQIPFKLYEETIENNKTIVKEVLDDNRVDLINCDTRDTLDAFQFKKAMCEDYLLGKGAYAFINRKSNDVCSINYVEDIYVVPMRNVDHIKKSVGFMIDGKEYKSYDFIKLLRNTKDGATGTGLVEQINKALETAFERIKLESDLMKTCGNKKGFLRSIKHLDKEGMEKLRKAWNDYYAGNSSCVILNDGMEFKEASNTSVENQLNEKTLTFKDEMKEIFHIGDNYDDFIKKAITPIATAFCIALNKDLLLEKEKGKYYFAPDLNELLKGSLKERYEAYKIAVSEGWLTRNEVRYKEDMNKLEGLDVINLGLGSVLLDPETGEIYTPNTNTSKKLNNKVEGGE